MAIIVDIAPVIRSRARACRGREALNISRAVLLRVIKSLINLNLI